ncbi:MAG: hypothetical protein AB7O97_16635 [Planctomycetota bacterium]
MKRSGHRRRRARAFVPGLLSIHAPWGASLAASLAIGTLAAPAAAQDQDIAVTLALRVTAVTADGKVVVDRGERDLLRIGDVLELLPPDGTRLRARVVQVDERSAIVELAGGAAAPRPGTKGEVRIPRARAASRPQPAQPVRPRPAPQPQPQQPRTQPQQPSSDAARPDQPAQRPPSEWPARDDGWQPGMPLLAAVEPLRPEQRPRSFRGRFTSTVGMFGSTIGDGFDPLLRTGLEFDSSNPAGHGGELHFDAEFDVRTEGEDDGGVDLLLRRLSYSLGGTRFAPERWEAGRFLHTVMPELGVVDGVEWSKRAADGSRLGVSFGFLPEPDEDFESGKDLQLSVAHEWLLDADGTTRFAAGLQKTWHHGTSDRDAVVLTFHQVPIDGWQLHGFAWIDVYFGDDAVKGKGIELTAGRFAVGRTFENSGFDLSWTRTRFPEIRRREFPLLSPDQLADERNDRLVLDTWQILSEAGDRVHATLTGFDDDERAGGIAELGLALQDRVGEHTTLDLVAFGGQALFERELGGRVAWSRFRDGGHVQLLYELAWHRIDDRPADGDDLFEHRLGATYGQSTASGWVLGGRADLILWDDEVGWSMTLTAQTNF